MSEKQESLKATIATLEKREKFLKKEGRKIKARRAEINLLIVGFQQEALRLIKK